MMVVYFKFPVATRQHGFVMLAVIWVLLGMLAGVALFSHWVYGSLEHAHLRQKQLNSAIAAQTVMNATLYARLTGIRSVYGIMVKEPTEGRIGLTMSNEELMSLFEHGDMGALLIDHEKASKANNFPFDDRVWSFGDLHFIAQDTSGLIGLTDFNRLDVIQRLLDDHRIPAVPRRLLDSYLDYRDGDNERRMSGAEVFDYRLQQRTPPLNGALRTPLQLRDVMHWDKALRDFTNGDLLRWFRIEGGTMVNINTAPEKVLSWLTGDEAQVQEILVRRRQQPFASIFEIPGNMSIDLAPYSIEPSDGIRFWWWYSASQSAWVQEFHYEALQPGPAALRRDWSLKVDVPTQTGAQQAVPINWQMLSTYPDFLGRN